jgi:hypothetical protein
VDRALGQPITPVRWGVPPSTRLETDEQDVRWEIEGPQGKAKAHVHAKKLQEQWVIDRLEIKIGDALPFSIAVSDDNENEAPAFTAPKAGEKKSESKALAPQINVPIPPDPGK